MVREMSFRFDRGGLPQGSVCPGPKEKGEGMTVKAVVQEDHKCGLCEGSLFSGIWFADAYVPGYAWGWICKECALQHGVKFGVGRGQKFDSVSKDKIEG